MYKESGWGGREGTHLIVFMYNSNLISPPLWLIAISEGPSPLYWVWGKCLGNLIEQLCVVSPWGRPLYCLLPGWLSVYVSSLPFLCVPLVLYSVAQICGAARQLSLWNYKVHSKRFPISVLSTLINNNNSSNTNEKPGESFVKWRQKVNLLGWDKFWAAIIKWSQSIVVAQQDKQGQDSEDHFALSSCVLS